MPKDLTTEETIARLKKIYHGRSFRKIVSVFIGKGWHCNGPGEEYLTFEGDGAQEPEALSIGSTMVCPRCGQCYFQKSPIGSPEEVFNIFKID